MSNATRGIRRCGQVRRCLTRDAGSYCSVQDADACRQTGSHSGPFGRSSS